MTQFSKMKEEFSNRYKSDTLTPMEQAMEILKEADSINLKSEVIKIKDALHTIYPKADIVTVYQAAFKTALKMAI